MHEKICANAATLMLLNYFVFTQMLIKSNEGHRNSKLTGSKSCNPSTLLHVAASNIIVALNAAQIFWFYNYTHFFVQFLQLLLLYVHKITTLNFFSIFMTKKKLNCFKWLVSEKNVKNKQEDEQVCMNLFMPNCTAWIRAQIHKLAFM